MLSDYERTQELVSEAYDSSGASQKQYEKTLDSLESKLNQLTDAWDTFLMGLSNSEVIKVGVSILTDLLNVLNGLLTWTSGGNSFNKTLLTLFTTVMAFKGLKKLLVPSLEKIGEFFGKNKTGETEKGKVETQKNTEDSVKKGTSNGIISALKQTKEIIKNTFFEAVQTGVQQVDVSGAFQKGQLSSREKRTDFAVSNYGGDEGLYLQTERAYKQEHGLVGKQLDEKQTEEVMKQYQLRVKETKESEKQLANEKQQTQEDTKQTNNERQQTQEDNKQLNYERQQTTEDAQQGSPSKLNLKQGFSAIGQGASSNWSSIFQADSFSAGAKSFGSKVKGAGIGNAMTSAMVASAVISKGKEIIDGMITTAGEKASLFDDAIDSINASLEATTSALSSLSDQETEYNDLQKTIRRLDNTSKDYYTTIKSNNSLIKDILNGNASEGLKDHASYDNGVWSVDDEFWNLYEQNLAAQQQLLENSQLIAESLQASAELSYEIGESGLKTSTITDDEQSATLDTSAIVGAIAATAGGALATALASGTAIGSFAGPVGAAIGAAVGLAVGGIAAISISSMGMAEEELIDAAQFFNKEGITLDADAIEDLKRYQAGDTDNISQDLIQAAQRFEQLGGSLDSLIFTIGNTEDAFANVQEAVQNRDEDNEITSDQLIDNYIEEYQSDATDTEKQKIRNRLDSAFDGSEIEEFGRDWEAFDDDEKEEKTIEYLKATGRLDETKWKDGQLVVDGEEYDNISTFFEEAQSAYVNDQFADKANSILQDDEDTSFYGKDATDRQIKKLQGDSPLKIGEDVYTIGGKEVKKASAVAENAIGDAYDWYDANYRIEDALGFDIGQTTVTEDDYKNIATEYGDAVKLLFEQRREQDDVSSNADLLNTALYDENLDLVNLALTYDKNGELEGKTYDEIVQFMQERYGKEDTFTTFLDQLSKEVGDVSYDTWTLNGLDDKFNVDILANADEAIQGAYNQTPLNLLTYGVLNDTKLSDEQKEAFLTQVGLTDFKDADEVRDFVEEVQGLGISTGLFGGSLNEATDKLVESVHAIDKLPDNIEDTILAIQDILEQARSGQTTYTKDAYNELIGAHPELEEYFYQQGEDFKLTIPTDEFANILAKANAEDAVALGEKVSNGEKLRVKEGETDSKGNFYSGQWAYYKDNVTTGQASKWLDAVGIDHIGVFGQELIDLWKSAYNDYINLQTNQQEYEEMGGSYVSASSAQEALQMSNGTEIDEELLDNYLDAELVEKGLAETVEDVQKALKKQNDDFKDADKLIKALTSDTAETEENFNDLYDAISSNEDILENGKGTSNYEQALNNITSLAQEAFGNNVTKEFVEQNLSDFQAMADGSEDAFQRIQQALLQNVIDALDSGTYEIQSDAKTIKDALLQLDGLNFDIYGNADFSQIFNEIATTKAEAAEFASMIESLGYTVEWEEYETQAIQYPGGIAIPVKKYRVVVNNTGRNTTSSRKSSSSGGGGGSSSKDKKQYWENPYDELYNTTEKINELERQRNLLEDEANRLIEDRNSTLNDLLDNQAQSIANLKQEKKLQLQIQKAELAQVKNAKNYEYLATKTDSSGDEEQFWTTLQAEATRLGLGSLDNYASYNEKTGTVQINWDKIEAVEDDTKTGEYKGSLLEAYVEYLEENSEAYEEASDRLKEIEDEIKELKEAYIQDYLDTQQEIYDAIVEQYQEEIDNLQSVFDGMDEANSDILNALQKSIDLERQIRDNTEKEEDIADKEARLAYLKRDTSGANALEIKQLEEELADAREEYSDTLIDQYLQDLQDKEDEASKQRDKQIELMQSQLDYQKEHGAFWSEVKDLWDDVFDKNGKVNTDSKLFKLLQESRDFLSKSTEQITEATDELIQDLKTAGQGESNYDAKQKNQVVEANKVKGGSLSDVVDENNKKIGTLTYDTKTEKWKTSAGNTYDEVEWDSDKNAYVATGYTKASVTNNGGGGTGNGGTSSANGRIAGLSGKVYNSSSSTKKFQQGINDLITDKKITGISKLSVDGKYGSKTKTAAKKLQSLVGASVDGWWGPKSRTAFLKSSLKAYKTGGLADETGLAWLDGTKSAPELVLNAKDTQNFIQLKDILRDVFSNISGTKAQNSSGDNYFDISIVVDEISSDYDVDQLASRIKQQIYDDSTYRNVNAINLIR